MADDRANTDTSTTDQNTSVAPYNVAQEPAPQPEAPAPSMTDVLAGAPPQMAPDVSSNLAGAPSKAPVPLWQKVVTGALAGLAGSAGSKSFGGGLAGGAAGGLRYQQQQVENQQDQQKTDSYVRFQSAQAAATVAQATALHQKMDFEAQDHKIEYAGKQAAFQTFLHDNYGIAPDLTFLDHPEQASAALGTMADRNGGTVPPINVSLQPAEKGTPGKVSVYSPSQQAMLSTVGYKDFVSTAATVQTGNPISDNSWKSLGYQGQLQAFHQAQQFLSPTPEFSYKTDDPNFIGKQIAQRQQQLANYSKLPNADPKVESLLTSGISYLQNQQTTQNKAVIQQGVDKINAEAGPNAKAEYGKARATAQAKADVESASGSGDSSKTGEAFMASLPVADQNEVKAFAEGRIELSNRLAASKDGQKLIKNLTQAYPGFDASRAPNYYKFRQALSSGQIGQGVNSLNTAIYHLGTMYDAADQAGTNWIPGAHQLGVAVGSHVATTLQTGKELVTAEVGKAVAAGVIDKDTKDRYLNLLDAAAREGKMKEQLSSFTTFLTGRLKSYQDQADAAKPSPAIPDFVIIKPETAAVIKKITGEDVRSISPSQSRQTLPPTEPKAPNAPDPAAKFGGVTRKVSQ